VSHALKVSSEGVSCSEGGMCCPLTQNMLSRDSKFEHETRAALQLLEPEEPAYEWMPQDEPAYEWMPQDEPAYEWMPQDGVYGKWHCHYGSVDNIKKEDQPIPPNSQQVNEILQPRTCSCGARMRV